VYDTDKHTVSSSSDHTVLRQKCRNAVRQLKSDGTEHRVSESPEYWLHWGSVRAETKRNLNFYDDHILLYGYHNIDYDVQYCQAMEIDGDSGHNVSNFDHYYIINGNRVPTQSILPTGSLIINKKP